MTTLLSLVEAKATTEELARHLDALDAPTRVAEIRALPAKHQARLYDACAGRGCTIERDFLAGAGPLVEVVHEGRNSLPAFRLFQKRFCRPAAEQGPIAWGYNHQPMSAVTGPGYFVAREATQGGTATVVIDYKLVPEGRAPSWPEIRSNHARLSRFIYEGTEDWMWRVSDHVTIGRARRATGWMDNWFVLCRRP